MAFPFGSVTNHLNKRHWNSVSVEGLAAVMVLDMIENSCDLVVSSLSRAKQERLGWAAG